MATRNHTKSELLAQLEQERIQNQLLAANLRDEQSRHREAREYLEEAREELAAACAEVRRLKNQAPKKVAREYGIPRHLRDAFFHATGLKSATPAQIKAWAGSAA